MVLNARLELVWSPGLCGTLHKVEPQPEPELAFEAVPLDAELLRPEAAARGGAEEHVGARWSRCLASMLAVCECITINVGPRVLLSSKNRSKSNLLVCLTIAS